MKEIIEIVIQSAVPGLTGVFGVWIGFYLSRNHQEKMLTRQSLSVVRPSIVNLIQVTQNIQNYYRAESADDYMRKQLHDVYTPSSLHEKFVTIKNAFEQKSYEISDVISPEKKRLISMAFACAFGVELFLPSKQAHPNFYNQGGGTKYLQKHVKELLNVLGKI